MNLVLTKTPIQSTPTLNPKINTSKLLKQLVDYCKEDIDVVIQNNIINLTFCLPTNHKSSKENDFLDFNNTYHLTLKPKNLTTKNSNKLFFKRVEQVLNENLTDPEFNAKIFSEKMQISRMQLHRKLKEITNMSTSAFIRSERLKLAVEILKKSDITINEIAYSVGFGTPSYFIKCFKKKYKKTPLAYNNNF